MPEDLKLSQIGSSQLPPPFRGLHSTGVRKHCQIIFACYFRNSSIHSCKNSDVSNIVPTHTMLLSGDSVTFIPSISKSAVLTDNLKHIQITSRHNFDCYPEVGLLLAGFSNRLSVGLRCITVLFRFL